MPNGFVGPGPMVPGGPQFMGGPMGPGGPQFMDGPVGVSRGYTDYHQGRAIHMADSRID